MDNTVKINLVVTIICLIGIVVTTLLIRRRRKTERALLKAREAAKFQEKLNAVAPKLTRGLADADLLQNRTDVLDLLTNANDHAHPNRVHHMKFKAKVFDFAMSGIVYKFKCLYCNFETKLLFKDFWGRKDRGPIPPPTTLGLSDEWANWGTIRKDQERSFGMGVDHGVLYLPADGEMRIGEFKQPRTDRSDAMMSQLLAYAELIKQENEEPKPQ